MTCFPLGVEVVPLVEVGTSPLVVEVGLIDVLELPLVGKVGESGFVKQLERKTANDKKINFWKCDFVFIAN